MATSEPRFDGSDDRISFTADINGNEVAVHVTRETIEDHLRVETLKPDERLEFIKRNQSQIIENVASCLREADDVTGISVGDEQLKHCR